MTRKSADVQIRVFRFLDKTKRPIVLLEVAEAWYREDTRETLLRISSLVLEEKAWEVHQAVAEEFDSSIPDLLSTAASKILRSLDHTPFPSIRCALLSK
jgi:hypothetical protein